MKRILIFFILVSANSVFAQTDSISQKVLEYHPEIRSIKANVVEEEIVLDLKVYTFQNYMGYPRVAAFLNDEQINEPIMQYYGQAANSSLSYQVNVPIKYADDINNLTFKLMGAEDGEMKDLTLKLKEVKLKRKKTLIEGASVD